MIADKATTAGLQRAEDTRVIETEDSPISILSPFVDYAKLWRDAGWLGTIPLPEGQKSPPPTGWTGRAAGFADDEQVSEWCDDTAFQRGNLGLHLGWPVTVVGTEYEIVGIDVDHYLDGDKQKLGGEQLRVLESELGELPPTWVSTARARNIDGSHRGDWTSGIRFYLVPRGLAFRGQVDKDIEVIQKSHRFAVVWPSWNPKTATTYRLYSPEQWAIGRAGGLGLPSDEIPDTTTIPLLPDEWVDYLTRGRMRDDGHPIDMDSSREEIEAWAVRQFNDGHRDDETAMCDKMRSALNKWKERIASEATSHDKPRDAHWEMTNLAAEGHTGFGYAAQAVENAWVGDVIERDKRRHGEYQREVFRERINALRKVKAKVDQAKRIGARYTPPVCACDPSHFEYVGRTMILRNSGDAVVATVTILGPLPNDTAEPSRSRRNAPLDLRLLRTTPRQPISWIEPDFIDHGGYVSLSAAPGTGKSISARSIAVEASRGRSAFDPERTVEPARVIYLDNENGEDWWLDGLDAMDAPLDLPNLKVICYPDLAGLDTAKGANEFHALIAQTATELDGVVDLIVLDTVSRFVEGGENDADTWSQFYRLAIQPLRDQKVAILRLDHLGKDADKGPRGSSHKLSDVDADFRMTVARAGSNELTMRLSKRRRQHYAEAMSLRRVDGPLRHILNPGPASFVARTSDGKVVALDPDTNALVADLDRLGVDTAFGREKAHAAYKGAGGTIQAKNALWATAVKVRKGRATPSGVTP